MPELGLRLTIGEVDSDSIIGPIGDLSIFDSSLEFPTIQVFDNESEFILATYAPDYTIVHAKDTDKLYVWTGSSWVLFNHNP